MPLDFTPMRAPSVGVGLALRVVDKERVLRITHLFKTSAYVMWVGNAEDARYARRPARISRRHLEEMASLSGACWGTLALPKAHVDNLQPGSEREQFVESAWNLIEPLVRLFDEERNLDRTKFSQAIQSRAKNTRTDFITLRRLLLRYYYFGRSKLALLPLPSGPKSATPGSGHIATEGRKSRRRGRQPSLASLLGTNKFVASEDDVSDMVSCFNRLLKKGVTYFSHAHEAYLGHEFRTRHTEEYNRYAADQSVEPVTCRQFRYYVRRALTLDDDLAKNLRVRRPEKGYRNALRSCGPGEIYEIDATGGRIALVSNGSPPNRIGTPWIYIIIDRWSRYIPSIYVTLQRPSYEEVRIALLISFTSRERFRFLGVDIDEERMPIGVFPSAVCADRGSELTCDSIQQALPGDLRVDIINLPPYKPDAKGIIERLIRELKRRMKSSRLKGVFSDRPFDPESKRQRRKAVQAASESILQLYQVLMEIVDDHNNRSHPALRRRPILAQAGVKPTPREAYLWGLKNITQLRRPPVSDEDIYRMLLSVDYATLSNGILRYRNRVYDPANGPATVICEHSRRRATRIGIRIDKSAPFELFIPDKRGDWAHFRISEGAAEELSGVTLDEEQALTPITKLLHATAEHGARVVRVTKDALRSRRKGRGRSTPMALDRKAQNASAAHETAEMKAVLTGKQHTPVVKIFKEPPATERWKEFAEHERLRAVEATRKRQGLL